MGNIDIDIACRRSRPHEDARRNSQRYGRQYIDPSLPAVNMSPEPIADKAHRRDQDKENAADCLPGRGVRRDDRGYCTDDSYHRDGSGTRLLRVCHQPGNELLVPRIGYLPGRTFMTGTKRIVHPYTVVGLAVV